MFKRGNNDKSVRKTVIFTILDKSEPEWFNTAWRLLITWATSNSKFPLTSSPSDVNGICPEVKIKSFVSIPCEYTPIAFGALDVLIFNGFEELFFRQHALLAGVSGLSMAFCPIASAYIIKTNYD